MLIKKCKKENKLQSAITKQELTVQIRKLKKFREINETINEKSEKTTKFPKATSSNIVTRVLPINRNILLMYQYPSTKRQVKL